MSARFRSSEITRAIRAAKAAGIDNFDIIPGPEGVPIVRVRQSPANDTPQDVIDEIEQWARDQENAA